VLDDNFHSIIFVMITHVEDTLVLRLLQKFYSVGFIGHLFFMSVMNIVELTIDARC